MWRNVGRAMAEFSVLARLWRSDRTTVHGLENFQAAQASGAPRVYVAVHLANWELLGPKLLELGEEAVEFYQPPRNRFQRWLAERTRRQFDDRLLPTGRNSAVKALRRLQGGDGLVMFIDDFTDGRVNGPALGRPLSPHVGLSAAVRLAKSSSALVIPAYVLRREGARFDMHVLAPMDVQGLSLDEATAAVNAILEPVVLANLHQWYLRPNWVTVEMGGVNGHSSLPRDIDWYMAAAQATPAWTGGRPIASNFTRRAVQDVLYNLSSLAMSPLYLGYRSHRPWHPLVEYAGWLPRLVAQRMDRRRLQAATRRVQNALGDMYLFPLQLDSDFQIRSHSGFEGMPPAIDHVVRSFARAAPAESRLVVKEHPLDNGLVNWGRIVRRIAQEHGVSDRVDFLNGSPIEPLIDRARGVVTVNSTSGFVALSLDRPVIALGSAIYDLPRLTFQGPLDAFWTGGEPPQAASFDAFRRVVAARTQVNGGFFSRSGLEMAVAGAMERLRALPADAKPWEPEDRPGAGADATGLATREPTV
jgi:capsule polysaccharide modification protein KpsS